MDILSFAHVVEGIGLKQDVVIWELAVKGKQNATLQQDILIRGLGVAALAADRAGLQPATILMGAWEKVR